MDNLVNVVNGVVVDASVYAFTAQTVTLVFASLSGFNANLFHLQSLTKLHTSLCVHVTSPYVDRHSFVARGRAELLKWSGEGTGPTLTFLPLAGSLQAEPLLQRALVPSVLCELTLPTVPTPPLPEPGEEIVRQS